MMNKKRCRALEPEMNDWDSDDGEDIFSDTDPEGGEETSSDFDPEMHSASSTDEEEAGTSDKENSSPPRKKRVEDKKTNQRAKERKLKKDAAASSMKAKDGTVWIKKDCLHPAREQHCSFSETSGPTEQTKRKATSRLQSFLCLINTEMLTIIRDCTVHEAHRSDPSWTLSIQELMAFISLLYTKAMTCPGVAMTDVWSELFLVPVIKNTMPRDRYQAIMRFLRFDNKDTRAERVETDRFAAISDIWQHFVRNCVSSYTPGPCITIQEQLFPAKIRCPFLQYIATKPGKFGIKFWIAADLETKYMCNASPYLGKDPSYPTGERLSETVVTGLMEPFLDKGRAVTTDSFFTSLSLANTLLKRNTFLLGAMSNVRRELPPQVKDASGAEVFSTEVFQTGSVTLTVYTPRKKKTVCVLSTIHQNVQIGKDPKKKPNTVTDYNHMKSGVDIMDQKVRVYTVRSETSRWPVAVFFNMLDLAAMNAYILYKACTGSTERRRMFMAHLAEELRHDFLQERATEKEVKTYLRQTSVPPLAPGKKTQCQVLLRCNRNHSTERCVRCNRYTCRKCRMEGPWVCADC